MPTKREFVFNKPMPLVMPFKSVVDSQEVKEVTCREATVQDLLMFDREKNNMEKTIVMVSTLAGLDRKEVVNMGAKDFMFISSGCTDFLE